LSTGTESELDPRKFSKLLLEAVDHGLLMLGETSRQAIYDCIENSYQINRGQIPEKLDAVHGALTDLLGRGANMVETIAAERFYKALNLTFEPNDDWTLADYVNHAKKARQFPGFIGHAPGL
jgi:hypothetical protein